MDGVCSVRMNERNNCIYSKLPTIIANILEQPACKKGDPSVIWPHTRRECKMCELFLLSFSRYGAKVLMGWVLLAVVVVADDDDDIDAVRVYAIIWYICSYTQICRYTLTLLHTKNEQTSMIFICTRSRIHKHFFTIGFGIACANSNENVPSTNVYI